MKNHTKAVKPFETERPMRLELEKLTECGVPDEAGEVSVEPQDHAEPGRL